MNNSNHLPLPDDTMPPLPKAGEYGPDVCATVRVYLAIQDDLAPDQRQLLFEHVRTCPDCTSVQRLMQQTTHIFANLPASEPSSHVDQAVMTAITARTNRQISASTQTNTSRRSRTMVAVPLAGTLFPRRGSLVGRLRGSSAMPRVALITSLALAAVLLLALLTTMTLHLSGGSTLQVFTLPPSLSWNGYVLFHSEMRIAANGVRYNVDTYDDLSTGRMHVETILPGSLDVVVVGDSHEMLGLDMMHHVAQWGANNWGVDETAFNLAELRSDMGAQRATYLDKDVFHGQVVYRIRCRNGLVLLLDMHYRPVNVLRGAVGPGTGEPVYATLMMMPASHMSSSMWDMRVPDGFHMGTLPKKP